jgi:exopolyphosphatase / guanosine-5'-triphosphate,3'-diphosphate pyrophosphatase
MRIASIDLGTNTALMLIADVTEQVFETISDEQKLIRIGKGVDKDRNISNAAFNRCRDALLEYKEEALRHGAQRIVVTGTSALRDAANRDSFIADIYEQTGLRIEVLDGDDEARWTYTGAIIGMNLPSTHICVLDIGGGSTELTYGKDQKILAHKSVDIGCVRLTERFLSGPPPSETELDSLLNYIVPFIKELPAISDEDTCFIAVAGTATTLAAVDLGLNIYNSGKVAGHELSLQRISELYELFRPLNHDALISRLSIDTGRADIILSGIIILREIMKLRNLDSAIVSTQGLRYGIAQREALA